MTVTARPNRERAVPAIVIPESASWTIGDGLGQSPPVLIQMSWRCESKIQWHAMIRHEKMSQWSCPGLHPAPSCKFCCPLTRCIEYALHQFVSVSLDEQRSVMGHRYSRYVQHVQDGSHKTCIIYSITEFQSLKICHEYKICFCMWFLGTSEISIKGAWTTFNGSSSPASQVYCSMGFN